MLAAMVHQAQNPHGMMGRLFAPVMERLNQPAYRAAQTALSLPRGGHVLEIGFAPAHCSAIWRAQTPHYQSAVLRFRI